MSFMDVGALVWEDDPDAVLGRGRARLRRGEAVEEGDEATSATVGRDREYSLAVDGRAVRVVVADQEVDVGLGRLRDGHLVEVVLVGAVADVGVGLGERPKDCLLIASSSVASTRGKRSL